MSGITLYPDIDDGGLFHLAPFAQWSELTERSMGGRLMTFTGEVSFGLIASQWDAINQAFPGKRFAPLVSMGNQSQLRCSVKVEEPHAAGVRIVESLPFPKVVFSATLHQASPDYAMLHRSIREGWSARELLQGELTSIFMMRRVATAFLLRLQREQVGEALKAALPGPMFSRATGVAAVRSVVAAHATEWLTPIGSDGASLPTTVTDYAVEAVAGIHLISREKLVVFDNGESVAAWELRDVRELPSSVVTRLIKSAEERIAHLLVGRAKKEHARRTSALRGQAP